MDAHAIEILEFDKVRQMLSGRAASDLGREAALFIQPETDLETVRESLALTAEMRKLVAFGEGLGLEGVKDIREPLLRLRAEGASLSARELLEVATTLAACRRAKRAILTKKEHIPRLADVARPIVVFEDIEKAVEHALSPEGEVLDRASDALKGIRKEKLVIRNRIHDKLSSLLTSQVGAKAVQDAIITVRENRYVIPVRAEEKGRIKGIVHDISSSGATVFLEPLATVEMNNKLRELEVKEKREVERILGELSRGVRQGLEGIQHNLELLTEMDVLYAKASFANSLGAVEPLVNSEGRIDLQDGRHPLLLKALGREKVVPLNLSLGQGFTTLVITGPNTGGKTVALKTVGLLVLMAQSGMPVPAQEGSVLGVFETIYADIGDEQSIEQSLSTFSSHIREVAKVLNAADESSLVLMDEVGVGTDPNEGAALAMAVLDELCERGARVVATTHYGSLKVFAHSHPRMENASMEFDRETLSPSYRLQMGVPGGSYAMEIAERLGLPLMVISEAKRMVSPEGLKLDELIQSLEGRVRQVEQERESLTQKRRELERDKSAYEAKLKQAKEEAKAIKERSREETRALIQETKQRLEEVVTRLKEERATKETLAQARQAIAEEEKKTANEEEPGEIQGSMRPLEDPRIGETVWVERMNREGVLLSFSVKKARVETGGIRIELPLSSLSRRAGGAKEAEPGRARVTYDTDRTVSPELLLLGFRADEALEKLDHYLDEAEWIGLKQVRVVHGKGSGILRQKVKETLDEDPRVKAHRLGEWDEGGTGVTIVELT